MIELATTPVAPASAPLVVEELGSAAHAAWDAFVRRAPTGTPFHLLAWRRAVERVFGHEPLYLVARRGEEIVGVLPLFHIRSPFVGRNLLSVPYAVYGGIVAVDDEAARALLAEASKIAHAERVGCMELRYLHEPQGDAAPSTDLYSTFLRELPATADDCLGILPKKARAAARAGRDKHALELGSGEWYLEDFFELFTRNKRQLGSPGLPLIWFRTLCEEFGRECVVHVVRHELRPVAAVLSLRFGATFLPYYSGKLEEANQWSVDNFLYWQLMEEAVRSGARIFDFGRSRKDSGPYAFKKNQGFEPTTLHYRYHLVRHKKPPHFNPSNPKLALPRRIWTKMPFWAARALARPLSRYLP
jgi:FemAB-related protein (PEP-CTERM system-associated)